MGKDQQTVEQLLRSNPLLRNLAMFSGDIGERRDEGNSQRRHPLKIFTKNINKTNYKPTDNNFDNDYERVNETFFQEVEIADNDIRRLPTGRSLSSTDASDASDSDVAEENVDGEPFAVTESLLRSLESVDTEVTIPARLEKRSPSIKLTFSEEFTPPPTIPTKKKNETVLGLNKSQFQGYLYLKEMDDLRGSRLDEQSGEDFFSRVSTPNQGGRSGELPLVQEKFHQQDVIAVPRERGGYVVSGTRYYVDNRVDGDVREDTDVMQDEYKLRESTKEFAEMKEDPRFAVEMELSQMKKRRSRRRFVQKGTKTHDSQNSVEATLGKTTLFDPEPPSTVEMMKKGGRVFERRSTDIGGKMITVELANKLLHGVDLIVRPGSVVHGTMPHGEVTNDVQNGNIDKRNQIALMDSLVRPLNHAAPLFEENNEVPNSSEIRSNPRSSILAVESDARLVNSCFYMQADAVLSGVDPIEKASGMSEMECLSLCAREDSCLSLNYAGSVSTCEMFNTTEGPTAAVKPLLGYTYYMPKRKDLKSCMSDILSTENTLPESVVGVRCSSAEPCSAPELRMVESRARIAIYRLFSSRAECSNESAVLFIRSAGSRNKMGSNLDTVININEDDCLFSCLRNKAVDTHSIECVSAEYEEEHERCTLSSEPRKNELSLHKHTTFYEKICVSTAVANQCSGAAVDRRANIVIVGSLRDTASTANPEECIEKCVMAERELGFQCLSVMYYYDETVLNCILNDASAKTNPESLAEEDRAIVDYFGVDDCYGMPEVEDTRQKFFKNFPLKVEDDIIGANQTPGSRVEVLRRTRSSPNPPPR
ncbi:hypothetical protein Y032_0011g1228 [Ancylostoma ceylanicum]|nr:hypothetical protein Y032_0011g1228 [Ancylostoma ceylanicum]